MPDVDEKVMRFVEALIEEDPNIQNRDLFEQTKLAHPHMAKLNARQFNARYPLQVKRRRALKDRRSGKDRSMGRPGRARPSGRGTPPPGEPRDQIRHVFLQFASDLTAAEERKDLVRVLANLDDYVEQVLKGLPRS